MKTDSEAKLSVLALGLRGLPNVPGGVEVHASELYPRLQALGSDAPVSPLELAECFWEVHDLPAAWAQFQIALDRSHGEQVHYYLNLCRAAVAGE